MSNPLSFRDFASRHAIGHRIRRAACASAVALGISLFGYGAGAVPIDSDLAISGSLNMSTASATGNVAQTGEVRTVVGGVTTSSAFGIGTPGTNPLAGVFTDTGDGIGFTTSLNAGPTSEFDFIIDLGINFANSSATDTFTITVRVNLSSIVDADGLDSYAESQLDLEVNTVDQINSSIASDTLFGDVSNGASLGTFGAMISDIFNTTFDIVLTPGGNAVLGDHHQWEGGVFDASGASLVDVMLDITIDNIVCTGPNCVDLPPSSVSEPGTLTMLATTALGFALLKTRRRRDRR